MMWSSRASQVRGTGSHLILERIVLKHPMWLARCSRPARVKQLAVSTLPGSGTVLSSVWGPVGWAAAALWC